MQQRVNFRSRPVPPVGAVSKERPHHHEGDVGDHSHPDDTAHYYYRPRELVVIEARADRIKDALGAKKAIVRKRGGGAVVFELRHDDEVAEVTESAVGLQDAADEPIAGPHYVLNGEFHDEWGPATPPQPAQPLPALPTGFGLAGEGVKVGVVDTGLRVHSWFQGHAQRSRVNHPGDEEELDEGLDGRLDFEAGHGTFIAGIVLQHAPGASVVVRGVLDSHGSADDTDLALAILELALVHRVNILNLSWGGYTENDQGLISVRSALDIARSRNPDLVVVAAAGNHNDATRPFFPAAYPDVRAVGALSPTGTKATFTNSGSWVDISTQGEQLRSTFIHWNNAPLAPPSDPDRNVTFTGWATWAGTSFATPRIAGAVAAAMSPVGEPRKLSAQQALAQVQLEASPLPEPGLGTAVQPESFVGR